MSSTEDARAAILEDVISGVEEKQMSDRKIKKMDITKRLDALGALEESESSNKLFIKYGFY